MFDNDKLIIYNETIEKRRLICLELEKEKYWIKTDSNYKSIRKKVKNGIEYYNARCNKYEIDEYYYEDETWKSTLYNTFHGEIPTLNECRNAIIYLETTYYFTVLNSLLQNLNSDIIWWIKMIICCDINFNKLRLIKTDFQLK